MIQRLTFNIQIKIQERTKASLSRLKYPQLLKSINSKITLRLLSSNIKIKRFLKNEIYFRVIKYSKESFNCQNNIFKKVIYSCHCKSCDKFKQPLLQFSVSHDPSEIILIC